LSGKQVDARGAQALDGAVEAGVGLLDRGVGIRGEDVGDDVKALFDVIEDHHVVEENQTRVGDPVLVPVRIGDALAPAGHAVAEETDRAAEEGRQRLLAVDAQRLQLVVQHADRIGRRLVEAQAAPRLEADERIAADVFAAFDALEKERLAVAGKGGEGRHRRERVRAQLAGDGNDVVILAKFIQVH